MNDKSEVRWVSGAEGEALGFIDTLKRAVALVQAEQAKCGPDRIGDAVWFDTDIDRLQAVIAQVQGRANTTPEPHGLDDLIYWCRKIGWPMVSRDTQPVVDGMQAALAKVERSVAGHACSVLHIKADALDEQAARMEQAVAMNPGKRQQMATVAGILRQEARQFRVEAKRLQAVPSCPTCNDNGMVGGPSFHAPDEGGEPCPDCADEKPYEFNGCQVAKIDEFGRAICEGNPDLKVGDWLFPEKAARQAPASGEVEPLGYLMTHPRKPPMAVTASSSHPEAREADAILGWSYTPLYAHPPAKVPEDVRKRLEGWSQALTGWPKDTAVGRVKSQIDKLLTTPTPATTPQPAQQGSVPDEMTYEDVRDLLALAWKGAVTTDDEAQVQAIEDKIIPERTHPFIGDYRKQPKTDFFCAMCQRDLKPGECFDYVFLGDPTEFVVHPSYLDGSEIKVAIGTECSKKIPAAYRVTTTPQPEGDGWIKCRDQLPKLGQRVELFSQGVVQHMMPLFDEDDEGLFWDFEVHDYNPPVDIGRDQWRPMPQPPVEQEGDHGRS